MPGAFAHMVAVDRGTKRVLESSKFPAAHLTYVPFPKNDQQDILNFKVSYGDGRSS